MIRRELVEELNQRKIAMTAAIWSNNSWDKVEEASREDAIEELEKNFSNVILRIYGGKPIDDEEEEIDYENNPFFAAAKRGMDKIHVPEGFDEDTTTREMVQDAYDSMELDQ